MNIYQLKMILSDMYTMDSSFPLLIFRNTETFETVSYTIWAVDELEQYIVKRIYPLTDITIDELIDIINEFTNRMYNHYQINMNKYKMFFIAGSVGADVRDVLLAMR